MYLTLHRFANESLQQAYRVSVNRDITDGSSSIQLEKKKVW